MTAQSRSALLDRDVAKHASPEARGDVSASASNQADGEGTNKATQGPPPSAGRMRSSSPLLVANLLEAIVPFIRNIALARLISPQDFGLAVSLSVVLGMIEVMTDFGLPVFAVRKTTPLPADETMMTLQSMALVRSAIIGVVLLGASPLLAQAFHAPDATAIYALVGLVAFLRGFENLSVKEQMREAVFWREAVVTAATQAAILAVTLATAAIWGGFECMIWGMLAGAVTTAVISNVLAPRPYRLRWNPVAVRDAASFGRPLILNGTAVAFNTGDRLLVGTFLGPATLALYNIAIGTATLPRTVIAKFFVSYFVPMFADARADATRARALADGWSWCLSGLAFLYGLGLAAVGDRLLGLVFGAVYQPSRLFMCLAGLSLCIKFLMMLPVPAAYAAGRTKLISQGSVLSALAILPGALSAALSKDVALFLLSITLAEFLALLWFAAKTCREQNVASSLVWPLVALPVTLLSSLAVAAFVTPDLPLHLWIALASAAGLIGAFLFRAILVRHSVSLSALLK